MGDPTAADDTAAPRPRATLSLVGVALVLVGGLWLRAFEIDEGGIWLDEGYSLLQSERTTLELLALNPWDPHPPLYLITLRVWRSLFGTDAATAKALGVLLGCLGIAGVAAMAAVAPSVPYAACRTPAARAAGANGPRASAAALAALFIAVHPLHLTYSRELRGYVMVVAALAWSSLAFSRWLARPTRARYLGWLLASWLAVNTEYFAWYFVVAQVGVMWHARRRARPELTRGLALALPLLLLSSAQSLWALGQQLFVHRTYGWIARPSFDALIATYAKLATGEGPAIALALALVALGVHDLARLPAAARSERLLLPAAQLALPLLIFVLSQLTTPTYQHRYFLICLVPLAGLMGAGAACLHRMLGAPRGALATVIAALLLTAGSAPGIHGVYIRESMVDATRDRTRHIREHHVDGDLVLYTDHVDFAPGIALHPAEWPQYLLDEVRNHTLLHYVARPVTGPLPTPGDFRRLWVVSPDASALQRQVLQQDWFARLGPSPNSTLSRPPELYVYDLSTPDGQR